MPRIDNTIATKTSDVSLTTTEAALIGTTGFALVGNAGNALAFAFVPQVTALGAADTVTVTLRAGTTNASTQFGGATATNNGAGSGASPPLIAIGVVPAGTENIYVGGVIGTATGTAKGSATAPIIAGVLYLD